MSRSSDSQALINHIFAQTQANVSFLASQNYITGAEASEIVSRLSAAQSRAAPDTGLANSAANRRNAPPPAQPAVRQARAVWAYNEDMQEPNDLSFSVGETVEILDETNADWWTGRCRGRQGLFPSNHVQVIPAASSPIAYPPPSAPPAQMPVAPVPTGPSAPYPPVGYNNNTEKPVYRPFGAVYQGTDQPPPAQVQVAPVNTVGLQQAPGQEQKQKKWGRLGNTMANSAAGGVGFGAGAAIGGGIVNAIF